MNKCFCCYNKPIFIIAREDRFGGLRCDRCARLAIRYGNFEKFCIYKYGHLPIKDFYENAKEIKAFVDPIIPSKPIYPKGKSHKFSKETLEKLDKYPKVPNDDYYE